MKPLFDNIEEIVLSIKGGSFDGDVMPFLRYERDLMEEANAIKLGSPSDAIDYLADGVTILNSMIFSLREDRYGAEKGIGLQLELIEAGLINVYEHFLKLLTEIEKPKD